MEVKQIFIIFLMLLPIGVWAQVSEINTNIDIVPDSVSIGPEISDDTEIEVEEENLSMSLTEKLKNNLNLHYVYIPDTLFNVPAYDHYFFWDTINVHPYISDLTRLKDTIPIILQDSQRVFTNPIYGKVNSDFGWRKWKYHYGIDIDLNTGDSLFSAFDGVVRMHKRSRTYGNVIVIRHYNGLETLYAHLSKIKVEVNQEVKAGELIGLGGNTGRSSGPHLHFEVRYQGGAINPNEVIDYTTGNLRSDTLWVSSKRFEYLHDVRTVRYHTIRKGDTLSRIGKRYGVRVSQLCKLNGMSKNSILRIGRRIRYT